MTSILGTGSSLPENVVTNDDYAKTLDTSDEWIFSRTGIKSRHIATTETLTDIALEAAKGAMESSGTDASELGLIVSASVSQHNLCPSLSCEIMQKIGAFCPAMDVNAACSGFIYAIKTADALRSGKKALVLGAEKLSSVTDFTDRASCVLFGDGAGAVVLGDSDEGGILHTDIFGVPDPNYVLHIPGVGSKEQSVIKMDGREVYKFATRVLEENIRGVLEKTGIDIGAVRWIVPHQANLRIVKAAASRLGLPLERFYMNIETTGNTSSASVAIALDELARSGQLERGDILALAAFGGGLTSGVCLLRW